MGVPLNSFGISLGILWDFHDISIGFLYFYEISAGFQWDPKRISMVCPWYFHGIPVGFLLDLHEAFVGFL